jgi:D-serine deaminase-like pyridoxal phosphate-dependent protein
MLDLNAFEFNVAKMAQHCRDHRLALRPHGKTHKCPEIAKALIRAGAVGACAAKISEAEVFAANGVRGLLVTTPVIGRHKIERAVCLATRHPDTLFVVDDAHNVHDLDEAARAAHVDLNLVIDLQVGRKGGIQPRQPALGLARLIASLPNLKLIGLQAYAGHASHVAGFAERSQASEEALRPAVETKQLFEKEGIECALLTAGSTGTYNIDTTVEGITELQPGSFIFMDLDYHRLGGRDGPVFQDFRNSLSVLTTVVSKPSCTLAIVDGGFKAFATDRPFMPAARDLPGVAYSWGGDEHGRLDLTKPGAAVNLGDRVEFEVPHCDPTVNLYDRIFCLRGNAVEAVWKIAARGMSQ